ncbi:MAG: thiamine phosphate synthase [Mariprofundales bacterium]|nr:thiamine phosphate synthase [Mariprofundales bacterium]
MASHANSRKITGVYGILPADLPMTQLLYRAEAALNGGIKWLQFRDKKQGFKRWLRRAERVKKLCQCYRAQLIVNDSIELATSAAADGVHLGRSDLPTWTEVRAAHDSGLTVGVSCRADAQMAQAALDGGADYLSFGAIFPTSSKRGVPPIGLARLAKARQLFANANLIAIGGITHDNIVQVKEAGADAAALISGLFEYDDITSRAQLLTTLWQYQDR